MKKTKFVLFIYLFLVSFTFSQESTTKTSLSFIAFGDWGRDGDYGQQETADGMGVYAEKHKMDFILTLGDNFYPAGVKSTKDKQWKTSFEDVYSDESLQCPWYICFGNHDYRGSIQAQINYTYESKRWNCPGRYYSFVKKVDDSTDALFVILDTYSLIVDNTLAILQLDWLDSILAYSTAKWKIAAGHHPMYSGGVHGNTAELIDDVKPLFEKYKVNIYLAGHDHDMQYLKEPHTNIHYFVSGGGSELRDVSQTRYTLFSRSMNGFLALSINRSRVRVNFINDKGKRVYTVKVQ
ncbi:MAG TPA: tartrate-resistant acid phosphatase type 5 family protein [Ignavibacteria bacterium]